MNTGNTGLMTHSTLYLAFCYTPPSQPSKPATRYLAPQKIIEVKQAVNRASTY